MKYAVVIFLAACGTTPSLENEAPLAAETSHAITTGLRAGSYYSSGEFNCFFLNSKVTRPFPAHWQVTEAADGSVRLLGAYPILNSQPIDMHLRGETLYDEAGKKRGSLTCKDAECDVDFDFESNSPLGGRSEQTYRATWTLSPEGFAESAKLTFHWLPLVGTCHAISAFQREL